MLHYAVFLQAFNYDIKYRNSEANANADGLSRLPLKSEQLDLLDNASCFQLTQIEKFRLTARDIGEETLQDQQLSAVRDCLIRGRNFNHLLKAGREEISLQEECIVES